AELVHAKVITGIRDIADPSDRNGMPIWIELKRGELAKVVLNQLYKHTPLQTTYGANVVTLVGGTPRTLGLKALLRHYVDHQKEVITRRTKFRLERAQRRLHVLEGYLIALDNLDRVIAIIRNSADADAARETLMAEFGLSEEQSRAILDLRLRALTALQQDEVRREHGELVALVTELRAILSDEARVYAIVKQELGELGDRFGDDRRTEIVPAEGELDLEQLIREEDMVISITQTGYVKRVAASTYRQQKRGGVGVMGMDTKDDDWIEHLLVASTHDYVLFFTSVGKVYRLKVHELPEGTRQGRGRAVVNLRPLREGEHVRTVIATRDFTEGMYLVQATKGGIVKKTLFKEYDTPRKSDGIIAINIREGDELVGVRLTSGEDDVLLTSRKGQTVRFDENEARAMGRATGGVIGMKLRKGDEVIAIDVADDEADLLVVTENGYGKRTRVAEYPRKGRGTMGVLTIRLVEARGAIVRALVVGPRQEILVITESGTVQRTAVDGISQMGRATQGVIVQRLREGDRISAVAMVDSANVGENGDAAPLELAGLSSVAPEIVPYVSADAAEAAAEHADDGDGRSAIDEIMDDTADDDGTDAALEQDDEDDGSV
ncbi:MAG: gyrase subunit, partial [Solirubrobacteraceae bacterium]|nr:gyrase subunit [Solirubrobacteraceae bacterium]